MVLRPCMLGRFIYPFLVHLQKRKKIGSQMGHTRSTHIEWRQSTQLYERPIFDINSRIVLEYIVRTKRDIYIQKKNCQTLFAHGKPFAEQIWSQFHQCFTRAFFVPKCFAQIFSIYALVFWPLGSKISAKQVRVKCW